MSHVPDRYSTDFGRLSTLSPRVVVHAHQEQDVVDAFAAARDGGLPCIVRGAGHSCGGQTLTDGVLVVNEPDATPPRLLSDDHVELSARARWRDVERHLNGVGRTIPVLADYLDLSVGGTLSVGGYGAESVIHGAQVDHVTRLRLVTPGGGARWCSADEDPQLFARALAGLGRAGAIETAVMRTVPYRPYTALRTSHHENLAHLLDSVGWLMDTATPPMMFKALHARGRFVSTCGMHAATIREAASIHVPRPPQFARPGLAWIAPHYRRWRSGAVKLWLARFPNHGRFWIDYLFNYEGLRRFGLFVQQLIDEGAFAGCLRSVYVVAIRRQPRLVRFPLEASDAIDSPMAFGIGLYSMVPPGASAVVAALDTVAARCLEQCLELGGRPYLYGRHRVSDEVGRALYGSEFISGSWSRSSRRANRG